jgi:hypothetical protein
MTTWAFVINAQFLSGLVSQFFICGLESQMQIVYLAFCLAPETSFGVFFSN